MRVAFEAIGEIKVPALALLPLSVTEVAVMMMKVPQAPAGEQLQITPPMSWETLALTLTAWLG
jgi:hypothetical protein